MLNIMASPESPDNISTFPLFVGRDDLEYAASSLTDHSTFSLGVSTDPFQGERASDTSLRSTESGNPVLDFLHHKSTPSPPWTPSIFEDFTARASSEPVGSSLPSATSDRQVGSHDSGDSSALPKPGDLGENASTDSRASEWVTVRTSLSLNFEVDSH
ncbi:hypothetical protein PCL_07046 [Purpureocillium lilacinum]|uniref:Uncharacterized protein n=1 Tax=Purpureocillium lilacinum TaxID=33203 RepID=A0A2U3DT67_PURLI|nr:hypothetical protein PCL_07046 [Purpureocillium lilacinum]